MTPEFERQTVRKIFWRIMPVLMFGSAMAYIDRTNIGFAALTMNRDLGLSAAQFGIASGIFVVTYALFEMPSNAVMARVGARIWLTRIMVTWGIVCAAMALTAGFKSLVFFRLLIGAAEAGFTPGVLWVLSFWFPRQYRGRAIALFLGSQVVGVIFGASLTGPLLDMSVLGVAGWRWMFIVQGIITVLGGIALWRTLPDNPASATWLSTEEKNWLSEKLAEDSGSVKDQGHGHPAWRVAVSSPRVLMLTAIYFLIATSATALTAFMPLMLHDTGLSLNATGLVSSFIWTTAAVGTLAFGWWIDRGARPEFVVAGACLLLVAGFAAMAFINSGLPLVAAMCLVAIGGRAAASTFWSIPSSFVSPTALGMVIAFISSLGIFGGLAGPAAFGVLRDRDGDYESAVILAASVGAAAALLVVVSSRAGRRATKV